MDYQSQTLFQMKNNLQTLNPMELQELDDIITPRAAELLSKAFGHGIYDLLAPLTENDELDENTDMDLDMDNNDGMFRTGNEMQETGSGSEEGLRRMMRDPRYWRERDPELIQKVTKGFQRLYPRG